MSHDMAGQDFIQQGYVALHKSARSNSHIRKRDNVVKNFRGFRPLDSEGHLQRAADNSLNFQNVTREKTTGAPKGVLFFF
ncbi:MAG: hypothetical protein UY74_C0037G0010 [Candidatus Kaiserbacteria bacterium GW2011_GWC2_52_8b]|uniref:Uncharacterized protein n=1 Tax=Candidatus Kaiserbacteria bacterium GW2011_GWC2_52_8b TaxID=1618676 RepID=A0A0G1ZQT0_9BACT|nr:MAG: hypothetical protein UY74_C0037G0010 [Candidatus Kaiserbacteria bacterium GW2011_GWC2_52_8b]